VFRDIGVANPEQHLLKAQVVHVLGKLIAHSGMTQTAAARLILSPHHLPAFARRASAFALTRFGGQAGAASGANG